MEMQKPTEEHRKLQSLAGTWKCEETMFPSPWDAKGGTATAKVVSKIDIDGFFLITDYVQERGGQVTYRGHGVYGYSNKDSRYTMHWFDSMGDCSSAPAFGTWTGNRLVFEQKTPMGLSRYTYDLEGEGRYKFTIENSQDGKSWTKFLEGKATKV